MRITINKIIFSLISVLSFNQFGINAQNIIEIAPLFEYPTAPESLSTLTEKTNYLVEHFWDPMDFKSKTAVDQNALNDAMKVYSVPLRLADKAKTEAAVNKLIEKISKNPIMLTQFTKAAEENLYGPRAEFWIDDIYVKFLNALVKNKKIPEARKAKYQKQLTSLSNTKIGQTAPEFTFTGRNGKNEKYLPMSTPTIIIFGDPTLPDWRLARLRMETNVPLTKAIDQGKLNILYVIPFEMDNWEKETANYSPKWAVGNAPGLEDKIDIRSNPAIYYIDKEGKLILKNTSLNEAINQALSSQDIQNQ